MTEEEPDGTDETLFLARTLALMAAIISAMMIGWIIGTWINMILGRIG